MTINCNGSLIDLATPKVMGILNLTPNSFFDGGKYESNSNLILSQTEKMLTDGATFIDIGGYSTKPNADFVSQEEEINRVLPAIKAILQHFPSAILSIDTFRASVAALAIDHGVAMVNDISAGNLDPKMMQTIANHNVPYIMMHTRGTPNSMQTLCDYDNLLVDLFHYFTQKINTARSFGIQDLILDPGFGFAKTLDQNFQILKNLSYFESLNLPILVGISRKSMVYNSLETTANEALNGTTVLNTLALNQGAKILRVHDVKQAKEAIILTEKIKITMN